MKVKWLRTWGYFLLPLNSVGFLIASSTSQYLSFTSLIAAAFAILFLATSFGLYYRKTWGVDIKLGYASNIFL